VGEVVVVVVVWWRRRRFVEDGRGKGVCSGSSAASRCMRIPTPPRARERRMRVRRRAVDMDLLGAVAFGWGSFSLAKTKSAKSQPYSVAPKFFVFTPPSYAFLAAASRQALAI
jgi:hypothetical protein